MIEVRIPGLRCGNPVNGSHGHWSVRAKERKNQRTMVDLFLRQIDPPELPCIVTLVRLGKRVIDDDNLPPTLKAVRDEVALWLGLPTNRRGQAEDNDPRVMWRYQQGSGEYGVVIRAETTDQETVDAGRKAKEFAA